MRTHLSIVPPFDTTPVSACGRGARLHKSPRAVDCLLCKNTDAFIAAKEADDKRRHESFMTQVPRRIAEPWSNAGPIVCRECDGTKFRIGERTCMGHYQSYHCAECGHIESRLTETGMSA